MFHENLSKSRLPTLSVEWSPFFWRQEDLANLLSQPLELFFLALEVDNEVALLFLLRIITSAIAERSNEAREPGRGCTLRLRNRTLFG